MDIFIIIRNTFNISLRYFYQHTIKVYSICFYQMMCDDDGMNLHQQALRKLGIICGLFLKIYIINRLY